MNKTLAFGVYKFILLEINGWSKEDVDKLEFGEIEPDPIFDGLRRIKDKEGETK